MEILEFSELNYKDLELLKKYTLGVKYRIADMTLGVLIMWKKHYNPEFAIKDGCLFIKVTIDDKVFFFLPYNDTEKISYIENYAKEHNIPLKFMSVEDEYKGLIESKYKVREYFNRDFSDYLYYAEDIINFAGKKYSGQRNHINKFKKLYKYTYHNLTDLPKDQLMDFLAIYKLDHEGMSEFEETEFKNTEDMVLNYNPNVFTGGAILIENEIAAFSIAEKFGETLVIHIEKGLKKYEGVYPTMFNELVKHNSENIKFVNREDDSGDIGLRTSKMQYHPCEILNDNKIEII